MAKNSLLLAESTSGEGPQFASFSYRPAAVRSQNQRWMSARTTTGTSEMPPRDGYSALFLQA